MLPEPFGLPKRACRGGSAPSRGRRRRPRGLRSITSVELLGLPPNLIHADSVDLHWKLYELNGRFYRGRPKTVPCGRPSAMHMRRPSRRYRRHSVVHGRRVCVPHRTSAQALGSRQQRREREGCAGSHYRRSNFSERLFRPAADGWYPLRADQRARMPVLVDYQPPWLGQPLPPWPAVEAEQPYTPPQGRGRPW